MMITEIEDFFTKGCGRCARFDTPDCSTRRWSEGLDALRALCLKAGLSETVKWGHPVYMHAGRNIVIIGAFRETYRLSFFNAALMRDPEGVLEREGPNTQNPGMVQFDSKTGVAGREALILAYLDEAKGYAEAGILPQKVERDLDLPDELIEAMDADPDLAEAFHALTPGRQKSWVIHLTGTRTPATRMARIARGRDKVLAGKGAMER